MKEQNQATQTKGRLDFYALMLRYPFIFFLLAALLFFGAGLHNEYADDAWRVTSDYSRRNVQVEQGIDGIPEIFKSRYSEASDGISTTASYGYRPLPEASFALEWALWGQAPRAAHAVNLVLYAGVCTLFLGLMRKLFPDTKPLFLLATALLFLIHPVHSEIVFAHKNREALMAGIFGLWYLLEIHAYFTSEKPKHFWVAMFSFVLGLFCKDDIFLFMTLVPGIWWIHFRGSLQQIPRLLLPFIKHYFGPLLVMLGLVALAASVNIGTAWLRNIFFLPAMILLAIYATSVKTRIPGPTNKMALLGIFSLGMFIIFLAIVNLSIGNPLTEALFWENPLFESNDLAKRAALAIKSIGFYLRIFLLPYPLSVYYGYDTLKLNNWITLDNALGLISLIALISAPFWAKKQTKMLQIGLFWHAIGTVLLSNLFAPMTGIVAERYFFSVSFGLCLIAGGVAERLPWERWRETVSSSWKLGAHYGIVSLLLTGWIVNFSRAMDWSNYGTLYRKDALRNPQSAKMASMYAHWQLRNMSKNQPPDKVYKEFENIIQWLDNALTVYPTYADVLNLKGNLLMETGKFDQAIVIFRLNIISNPEYLVSYNNLGTAYLENKQYSSSIKYFQQGITAEPKSVESYLGLTSAYVAMEYWDSAGISLNTIKSLGLVDPDISYLDTLIKKQENPFVFTVKPNF